MAEIVNNKWRALIKLTSINPMADGQDKTDGYFYLDITRRPLITELKDGTTCLRFQEGMVVVKETVAEICESVEKLLDEEATKKAEEYKAYYEATQARVAENAKVFEGK